MSDKCSLIRRIPYPYKAMLAICSDLDETPDADSYFNLMRFLNTSDETSCGRGVNLEIGNSIYFDMPKNQFSYWNTDEYGRKKIRELIKSGHIDCLHSFGDLASTRKQAETALEELEKNSCRLKVWVDHAVAPTNFGADIMQGYGDVEEHQAYHADLSTQFGIEYVWTGRVTSVIGQDRPFNLMGIADWKHPVRSADTLGRELIKHILGRFGSVKYNMHSKNRLIRQVSLRNGTSVHEFIRCNPHWGGVGSYDRGDGIHNVLTERFLQRLIHREGICILYTHLGKVSNRNDNKFLPEAGVRAFKLLAKFYQDKKVLVTTTRRLLDYINIRDNISLKVNTKKREVFITSNFLEKTVSNNHALEMLSGITFDLPERVDSIKVNGVLMEKKSLYIKRFDNSWKISFPWHNLEYPFN